VNCQTRLASADSKRLT